MAPRGLSSTSIRYRREDVAVSMREPSPYVRVCETLENHLHLFNSMPCYIEESAQCGGSGFFRRRYRMLGRRLIQRSEEGHPTVLSILLIVRTGSRAHRSTRHADGFAGVVVLETEVNRRSCPFDPSSEASVRNVDGEGPYGLFSRRNSRTK